jgi:hypothetical protein
LLSARRSLFNGDVSDWHYILEQEQKGPVAEDDLKASFAAGQLPPDTFVWKDGMENWVVASDVPAFNVSLSPMPAVPPVEEKGPAPVTAPAAITPAAPAPAAAQAPRGCVACHSPAVVPGFATALCQPCRDKLIKFPIPVWLKGVAAALVVLFLVSAVRVPGELGAAVTLQGAKDAQGRGDYPAAIKAYQSVLASYPKAEDALRGMAQCALAAGDAKTALDYANQLVSPTGEVSKDDVELIEQIKGAQK